MPTAQTKTGKLFLILGPSGVGKGTVVSDIRRKYPEQFVFPISVTTRPKRPQEKEGETYFYISRSEFEQKIAAGDFLEWACVHGDHLYGTLKKPIFDALAQGKNVVRELDIQGFESIRAIMPPEQLVSIFLLPPSLEILKKRILHRAPLSAEEAEKRMESARIELEKSKLCDYRVQTQDQKIADMFAEVDSIIRKEIERL